MSFRDIPWKPFGWIALAAALYSAIVFDFSGGQGWEWLNTFMATILSVFAGIFLYRHQTAVAEDDRRDQLLTALAGELKACIGILRTPPTPIVIPRSVTTGEGDATVVNTAKIGEAVLIHLPAVVAEEALRAAVFDTEESFMLSNIDRQIHIHNSELSFILQTRTAQVSRTVLLSLQRTTAELKQRQAAIIEENQRLLEHLRSEGIEIPE